MENAVDEDEEGREEEVIVYANFEEGTVDKEIFQQSDLKFKIIGLDSDTPVVQLGETTFKGMWKDTIGTKVFFEEDLSPSEPVDPVFTVTPPKMLKYKCMSTKTLELSRIFLKPKNSENETGSNNSNNKQKNSQNSKVEEVAAESEGCVGGQEVLDLVECTVTPDASIKAVMSEIVEQSTVDILENT